MNALPRGLYLISDEAMLLDGSFFGFLEQALQKGLRTVQLRGKSLPASDLHQVAQACRQITHKAGALFIINDSLQLALDCNADGLHLGQEDLAPADARQALGPEKIIGLSTHNREQVAAASREPVDYLGFGPVFQTSTKEKADPTVGLDALRSAVTASRLPVVAIGGISLGRAGEVMQTGCQAIAVISAIARQADPLSALEDFLRVSEP